MKSFYFVGAKFCGLTTLDMFVDTSICGFKIICNITYYFIGILNSWIALPTQYMKLNVQHILMISHYIHMYSYNAILANIQFNLRSQIWIKIQHLATIVRLEWFNDWCILPSRLAWWISPLHSSAWWHTIGERQAIVVQLPGLGIPLDRGVFLRAVCEFCWDFAGRDPILAISLFFLAANEVTGLVLLVPGLDDQESVFSNWLCGISKELAASSIVNTLVLVTHNISIHPECGTFLYLMQ